MFNNYTDILNQVTVAAMEAGTLIMEIYLTDFSNTIQYKEDASPVTKADKLADAIITKHLEGLIKNCPVISEESVIPAFEARQNLSAFWLVDPLDGTKEFIAKNGDFTVNIALIKNNKPVFGLVYAPLTEYMFWAFKSGGAYRKKDGKTQPMHCNSFHPADANLKILRSRSHFSDEAAAYITRFNTPELIARGSSIKMMMIAAGEADIYPCFSKTMEWDTAASQIILEEAGGSIYNINDHSALQYNKSDMGNPFFIACGIKKV